MPPECPNPDESWAARIFEDTLVARIQGLNEGLLVAIITSGEYRKLCAKRNRSACSDGPA